MWIAESESAKYWAKVLSDLKNRGIKDILIMTTDGLIGMKEAVEAIYPKAELQGCVVHVIRNGMKYVSYKDIKEFAKDIKSIYQAPISKTMIGSVIVINFVYAWNFYLWPLVVINSNSMQTAQIGLQMLMTTGATRNWGIITAGTIIVLAPVLILFFAVQNLFVQGIVTTGLKE